MKMANHHPYRAIQLTGARCVASVAVPFAAFMTSMTVQADGAPPKANDGALQMSELVREGFRIRKTDHFSIAYDTSYDTLRPLIGRLEGTYDAIERFLAFNRVDAGERALDLPVILFDRFDDYATYAKGAGVDATSVAGFYGHSTNVAAFCNTSASPPFADVNAEMERLQNRLAALGGGGSSASSDRRKGIVQRLSSLRAQRDELVKRFNRFVIQHEAAHQVLFNLGAHVRGADNPLWFVEGLACQFEVSQTDPRGLLAGVNHMRLADFRDALGVAPGEKRLSGEAYVKAVNSGTWVRLRDVITGSDPGRGEEMAYYYGEAWALVRYLHHRRGDAFAGYLRLLRQREVGRTVPREQSIEAFRSAFGEPDASFERDWVEHTLKIRHTE